MKHIFRTINFSNIFNNKVYVVLIAFSIGLFTLYCVASIPTATQQNNEYIFENSASYIEYTKLILSEYENKKVIAITFDDGPGRYTTELLKILEKHNAKATFFILGSCVNGNEEIIRSAFLQGHEIATHGYSHKIMTKMSKKELMEDIQNSLDVLSPVVSEKIALIRAPYGEINDNTNEVFESFNLTNVKWTLDSLDWKLRNCEKVSNRVLKQVEPYSIILMHDIYKSSVEAVEQILTQLEGEYEFVTVSELMILKNNQTKIE